MILNEFYNIDEGINMKNNISYLNLDPVNIVRWCNDLKKQLGYSNARISELSGVPIGTVDRIMAGRYPEFKYSSIQPIISVLIEGISSSDIITDFPKEDYKHTLEIKNMEITALKEKVSTLLEERNFLKNALADKEDDIEYLKKVVDDLRLRNH